MSDKSIRAAQLVSPFGPGAVVDLGSESFTCMDISEWPAGECPPIQDNALQRALGLDIRRPPPEDLRGEVPFSRFPRWVFCPICRRLYHYTHADDQRNGFKAPACTGSECRESKLVPMRFVVACENGHLQDVDWYRWTHRNAQASATGQCSRQTAELYFMTSGASGGDFNAMSVYCKACDTANTFEGLTNRPYPFGCHGRQPWQGNRGSACDCTPRVFPRAASNVYYPQTRSALDIGHGAAAGVDRLGGLGAWLANHPRVGQVRAVKAAIPDWEQLRDLYKDIVADGVREFGLAEEETRGAVVDAIRGAEVTARQVAVQDKSQHGFLRLEWPHLSRETNICTEHLRTVVHSVRGVWPAALCGPFEQVTLVERLREVRALIGFKRVKPDNTAEEVPADLGKGLDWLPGIETFGEGIFVRFSESFLSDWESRVTPLVSGDTTRLAEACSRWGREPSSVYASPRFIALHTLSHGLIRRLAFDAGYSASSIRERIYCDHAPAPAAGILLYTSDGDSEGSLGGLVRQGNPTRLLGTLKRAIADLSWCSGDPVCSEMEMQGVDGMNSAACHACSLVSETSCAFNNSLLDRRLLIGSADGRIPGLLSGLASRLD